MTNHRKLVAALVGVALLIAQRHWNFKIPGLDEALVELIIAAGTPLAVWWFPNTKTEKQS